MERLIHSLQCQFHFTSYYVVLYDFWGTVRGAPHICVIRTGQPYMLNKRENATLQLSIFY